MERIPSDRASKLKFISGRRKSIYDTDVLYRDTYSVCTSFRLVLVQGWCILRDSDVLHPWSSTILLLVSCRYERDGVEIGSSGATRQQCQYAVCALEVGGSYTSCLEASA